MPGAPALTASHRPARGGALLLALLFILPPLLLHVRHLRPGYLPYLRDLSRTHLPVKRVAVEEMRHGRLPWWNPLHGAGSPLLANANFFHFHPVTILFLLLPYGTAFSLGLASLSVAASAGTGLWLRGRGASPAAAAAGAAAFALGGLGASLCNLYNLLASYAAVPWALLAWNRLADRPGAGSAALLALAFASALLGGEPTAFAWALLAALLLRPRLRPGHVLAVLLALVLAAPQLVPLAEATRGSVRGLGFTLEGSSYHSVHPARLLELVRPFPFGDPTRPWDPAWAGGRYSEGGVPFLYSLHAGLSVLALGVAGLASRRPGRLPLVALALLSLLLALGRHAPLFPALWHLVPPLHYFRYPEKLVLPFFLVLAALAARGVDLLRERAPRLPALLPVALVSAELLAAHLRLVPGAPARLFLEPPPVAAELRGRRTYFWLEPERYAPPERDDLLAFHAAYHRRAVPPAGMPFGVPYVFDPDPDILDPTRMAALGRLVHRSEADRERLLPLAAVERVLAPFPIDLPWLEALPSPADVHVYALREPIAYARVLPANAVDLAPGEAEAGRRLADPSFDPRSRAVLEDASAPPGDAARPATFARPDPATIVVRAPGPGLLVVAETFDPGWRARVDGVDAPVRPANLAFLGIALGAAGEHEVRIVYEPPSPLGRRGR